MYYAYLAEISTIVVHGFAVEDGARVRGIGDVERQRDVLQEIFARAFAAGARSSYDGVRPYGAYLARIAKNLMIDLARKRDDVLADDPTSVDDPAAHDDLSPEERIDSERRARVTRAYVEGLSAELRELVRLRFEAGRPQEEVAETLGVSRRRVRTLEKRVYDGLRRALRRFDRP